VLDCQIGNTKIKSVRNKAAFDKKRILVVGAGPAGLRIALEAKLRGAECVAVLEKRPHFARVNRMKMANQWLKNDLIGWGAKVFESPGPKCFCDPDKAHVGIFELQSMLLKCCIFLGVKVCFDITFEDVGWAPDRGWAATARAGAQARADLPRDDWTRLGAVIYCAGRPSQEEVEAGHVRGNRLEAAFEQRPGADVGIVANFEPAGTSEERALPQKAITRSMELRQFQELKSKTGVDLNIYVYFKGATHYTIMSTSKRALHERGCIIDLSARDLLSKSNTNLEALKCMARDVASHFGLPESVKFTERPKRDIRIFDYSSTRRVTDSLLFKRPSANGTVLPFMFAGDALLEPFWPTGIGLWRGYFGAFDVVYSLEEWFSGSTEDNSDTVKRMDTMKRLSNYALNKLKGISGGSGDRNLLLPEEAWSFAPSSRYDDWRP